MAFVTLRFALFLLGLIRAVSAFGADFYDEKYWEHENKLSLEGLKPFCIPVSEEERDPDFATPRSDFVADRSKLGALILRGPTKEGLVEQVAALRVWTSRVGDPLAAAPSGTDYHTAKDGSFWVSLVGSAPSSVLSQHDFYPAHRGPNCWNSALVLSKLLPHHRYTSDREFDYWMTSPLCQSVKVPEPGDIASLFGTQEGGNCGLIHAYIHLTDQLVFSKDGVENCRRYALEPARVIRERYVEASSACPVGVRYFRCHSLQSYLEEARPERLEELQSVFEQIAKTGNELERRALRGTAYLTSAESMKFRNELGFYLGMVRDGEASSVSGDTAFSLWKAARLGIESMHNQVNGLLLPLKAQ